MKRASLSSKGIVIFTHKERQYFNQRDSLLHQALQDLRKRYFVGMHWGHYHENVGLIHNVDFHMAGLGTVKFQDQISTKIINLCSRNFLSPIFHPGIGEKFWDIINISRPLRIKYLDEFIKSIRTLYDRGKWYRVLLVCPTPAVISNHHDWYVELYNDYIKLFSEAERSLFTLIQLSNGYPFCMPKETIAFLLRSSKVLSIYSHQEGESRVISEALLCGLPVIARSTLRGGGLDYLNSTNSRLFNTPSEAYNCFTDLLDTYPSSLFDTQGIQQEMCSVYTVPKLLEFFRKLFAENNMSFTGAIDVGDLDRALPSHLCRLPIEWRSEFTDDLNSRESCYFFINALQHL